MPEFKDYYKTLGLNKKAGDKEIKDAFKKLAKQHHPDTEHGSEDKFKELNEAYEVLRDKAKRDSYDYIYDHRTSFPNGSGGANGAGNGFNSKTQTFKQKKMYSDLNSFTEFYKEKEREHMQTRAQERMRQQSKQDPNNFSDFFEMFFGKYKERTAAAAGADAASKPSANLPRGEDFEMEIELSLEEAFHGCVRKIEISGAGQQSVRRLEVSIPAGVQNGTKIKVANEGKPGKNSAANGDLYLKVKLKQHEHFWLEDENVHSELVLLPHEAVLGATKKIPTLEDTVELVIPPNTHNGRILRLRSKGMKNPKTDTMSDHYVHVIVDIAASLTNEELTTYKYLRELHDRK